jgi:hypothetical protein
MRGENMAVYQQNVLLYYTDLRGVKLQGII